MKRLFAMQFSNQAIQQRSGYAASCIERPCLLLLLLVEPCVSPEAFSLVEAAMTVSVDSRPASLPFWVHRPRTGADGNERVSLSHSFKLHKRRASNFRRVVRINEGVGAGPPTDHERRPARDEFDAVKGQIVECEEETICSSEHQSAVPLHAEKHHVTHLALLPTADAMQVTDSRCRRPVYING